MRTRNANWFETNVQYERQAEDGLFAKVRETYVVDAFTFDEEKGKEKRTAVSYLVQAKNIEGALQNIGEVFSSSVLDYVVANVSETKIMDVFEHDLKKEPNDQPEV